MSDSLDSIVIFRNLISAVGWATLWDSVYLNPENVKIVLELNNYGNTTAEMPHESNIWIFWFLLVTYKQ
jgi:hypothetical protein